VGGVFVDDERIAGHELRRLATTEVDGCLHITVAVDDQRRDRNRLQLGAEIACESGQEERCGGPRRAVQALSNRELDELGRDRDTSFPLPIASPRID
jgi:hypothetical protein